jgi:hypothetical protein
MGDPKKEAALAARKAGQKIERPVQLTAPAVSKLIQNGVYKLAYDGQGLQQAGASNSNPDSTWINFNITTTGGKKVGYFHIHPDKRKKCGYASGNLRIDDDSSFGNYLVGRATDWQWVCDWLNE